MRRIGLPSSKELAVSGLKRRTTLLVADVDVESTMAAAIKVQKRNRLNTMKLKTESKKRKTKKQNTVAADKINVIRPQGYNAAHTARRFKFNTKH